MITFFDPYIEEKEKVKVLNYKYKGGDTSIFYIYCMAPLCDWLTPKFPEWLAPNVITITGFFFNLFYFALTIYYNGFSGGNEIPTWVCFLSAFLYFAYCVLDNCDGRQARRTGASSPLGLLVDHGTDACTTFFITCGLGNFVYYETLDEYLYVYVMITVAFFLNTWEEYYTGELILPIIHGVSEGMVLIVIIEVLSGIYGRQLFDYRVFLFNGLINNSFKDIIGKFGMLAGIFFGIVSLVKVCRFVGWKKFPRALFDVIIYILFLSSILCVNYLSNTLVNQIAPRLIILSYGLLFAKMMGLLQLSHIKSSIFNPYILSILAPILIQMFHSIIYFLFGIEFLFNIDNIIIFFLYWNFISWAHFVYFCSEELCEILNIKRFSIGKRHLK
jgi:ethanolaminephosphotransferase